MMMRRKRPLGGPRVGRFLLRLALVLPLLFLAAFQAHSQESVDPRSGRLYLTVTDLVLQAGAINLEISRTLETERSDRGLLGTRWRLNWESRLVQATPNLLVVEAPQLVAFSPAKDKPGHVSASGERLVFGKDGRAIRTRADGSREAFDAHGRLVERDRRNGNKIVLRYGADGRLARIEGPKESFLQLTADSQGRVVRVETSTGATVRYAYANDDLSEVQVNGGPSIRYTYDSSGNLVRIEDPESGAVELAYDPKGRVLSRRWADKSQERYEYDDAANTVRLIDPAGAMTTMQWSPDRRQAQVTDPLGHKSAMTYDAAGRLASVTGPTGATARITYDALGRLVSAQNAAGQVTRFDYVGDTSRVKAITRPDGARQLLDYDRHGNLTAVKVGGITIATLTYHPDASVASVKGLGSPEQRLAYHPDGRLKSAADPLGGTTQFAYDARGNLIRETNPLGGVTQYQYDAQNRLVSATDAVGGVTRYEYDPQGRLSRITDPAGGMTRYEYDARGRLVAETDAAGQVIRYEYDPAGRLVKTTGPGNAVGSFRYDAVGSLKEWTDPMGRTTRFDQDPLGRVTKERWSTGLEVRYQHDLLGRLVGSEDTAGAKSEFQYDAIGRLITSIDPLGAISRYQYDSLGSPVALTDPRGQIKRFVYGPDGALNQVREPSGDAARFGYDPAGRLMTIQRPSGGVTRFSYDAMGNVTGEVDPLGNQWRHAYDAAGQLVGTTDAAGRISRYVYDPMGRLTQKQLPDGKRVTYQYDKVGNLIQADDAAFPVRRSYDPAGRLVRVEYPAIKKAVRYEYDGSGLRTKLIDPEGRETRYEYNAQKQLVGVIAPDGKRITLGYDGLERLQAIQYPNGITGRWEYDPDDRVSKITYADKGGTIVGGWMYRYDAAGNLVEQADHQRRASRFQYDAAGQLTEAASPGGTTRYRYLPGGNRAAVEEGGTVTQYRHDAADRMLQAGDQQLTHDANGNLIARKTPQGGTSYEFDVEGRLTKVAGPSESAAFGYAPTGERVWKRDGDGLTYYLYDGFDLIQELDENGNPKATYVHGPGIDRPLAMLRGGRTDYYHADRLGSIRLLTDDQGQVAAAYDYDAFGKLSTSQGSVSNPFAFTGREWDASTGLYYYRARYYDPGLGRFLSPDPLPAALDEPLEQNPYLYVRNQPLRFVDPLGLNDIPDRFTPWDETTPAGIERKLQNNAEQIKQWRSRLQALKQDVLDALHPGGPTGWATNKPHPQHARDLVEAWKQQGRQLRAERERLTLALAGTAPGAPTSPPAGGRPKTPTLKTGGGGGGAPGGGTPRKLTFVTPRPSKGNVAVLVVLTLLGGGTISEAATIVAKCSAESAAYGAAGGCAFGPPGAAVGAAYPTARDTIQTVVGVGQALVNIMDQYATSPDPPPPPQLLPPPRLEGPAGPPPELPPPRTAEDPGGLLHPKTGQPIVGMTDFDPTKDPGMGPGGTRDQTARAGREADPSAEGTPPAEPRDRGKDPLTRQPGTYTETPGQPPGKGSKQPGPPPIYDPAYDPSSTGTLEGPAVAVPHETLTPGQRGPGTGPPGPQQQPAGPGPGATASTSTRTPQAAPAPTGQCPMCRERLRINCESITPGHPVCGRAGETCTPCPAGTDLSLPTVKRECYRTMYANQLTLTKPDGQRRTPQEAQQKAEGICRCNPGSGPACTGSWSAKPQ